MSTEMVAKYVVLTTVPLYLVAGILFLVAADWGRGIAFTCWGIANAALVWRG